MFKSTKVTLIALLLVAQSQLFADVSVSTMFSDHMVLQREMPVPVWGTASPGEVVTVQFAKQKVSTKANAQGKWLVKLAALKASSQGSKMFIKGKNEIVLSDVLVGEVWICSGQSNMQFGWGDKKDPFYGWGTVKDLKALIPEAKTKDIRSYTVPTFVSLTPQEDSKGKWSTNPSGSAIAFGFSYYLNQKLNVPVAVITTCWGSSSIEGWMPLDMTNQLPHFKKMMVQFNAKSKARIIELIDKGKSSGKDSAGWTKKENIFARQQPNILYNAMMNPLIPFACRGLVWYQGEANSKEPELYAKSLPLWAKRLRQAWRRDDFYVLAVMLPGYGKDNGHPESKSWAWFREAQKQILTLPNTGIVNAIDLGVAKNIHPTDKSPICKRLALMASRDVNGQQVEAQGPILKHFVIKQNKMFLDFVHANGLKTTDGNAPTGFWIAGKDHKWHEAKATIKGSTVVLQADAVQQPVACRYAFCGKPVVNLVNGVDLPAYPFRTDDWVK